MSSDWRWPGARWWKCDFHAHSPASYDFENKDTVTAAEWLGAALKAGLDAVAITDHNTGSTVDEIRAAAMASGHELAVFPGVELTVNGGVHLLVMFPADRDGDAVTAYLGRCDLADERRGRQDAVAQCTFDQAIVRAHERGGICIAAHADDEKGILKESITVTQTPDGDKLNGSQSLQQALKNEFLVAVESATGDQGLLEFVDGSKADYRRSLGPLPIVSFSDAHSLDQIGQRSTWFKMTSPTAEGIRLALLDGEEHSIRRSSEVVSSPNAHASNVIEAIEIENARYLGRGEAFTLRFNPWLNAIIGGRGTGKSTVIEFIRIAADRGDEIPAALQEELAKYQAPYQSRDDTGLLHEQAKLSLVYRKGDARFRIDWKLSDVAQTIFEDKGDDGWTQVEGDIRQRFPVRIYSQKQIFELAREPLALLRVIDEAEDVDHSTWLDDWREVKARFLSHRAKARELDAGLTEESRLRGELDDVKRRLEVFETAGHAEVLQAYQKRMRQHRAVENWEQDWEDIADRIREFSESIEPAELESTLFDTEDGSENRLIEAVATVHERFRAIRRELDAVAGAADGIVKGWPDVRDGLDWTAAVTGAIESYEAFKKKLVEEDAGDPDEYGKLVEERQNLEERFKTFDRRRIEIAAEDDLAEHCLVEMVAMRQDLTRRREQFLERVIGANPYVRIDIVPYGARETVESEIRKLLGREIGGFEKDIGVVEEDTGIVSEIYSLTTVEEGLRVSKARIREIADGGAAAQDVRDKRFSAHLATLPPENMDRLDCWFPEDSLEVQYSATSDGENFRSILEGSPGQKTAALLAFLLSYGSEPIILDQPEDDLDNYLIYDLIVTQLRTIKRDRQVIVVTHNANIVVNGDAEYVAALEARGGQTRVVTDGGLQEDNVRKTICEIMEGGEKAFETRYRRIGGALRVH